MVLSQNRSNVVTSATAILHQEVFFALFKGFSPNLLAVGHGTIQIVTYELMKEKYTEMTKTDANNLVNDNTIDNNVDNPNPKIPIPGVQRAHRPGGRLQDGVLPGYLPLPGGEDGAAGCAGVPPPGHQGPGRAEAGVEGARSEGCLPGPGTAPAPRYTEHLHYIRHI